MPLSRSQLFRPELPRLLAHRSQLPARFTDAKSADFPSVESAAGCCAAIGKLCRATIFRLCRLRIWLLWLCLLSVLFLPNACVAATPGISHPWLGLSLFQTAASEPDAPFPLPPAAGNKVPEVLFLKNGDRLTGFSQSVGDQHLHFELPYGSVMRVPITDVDHLELAPRPMAPPPSSPIAPLVAPLDKTPTVAASVTAVTATETGVATATGSGDLSSPSLPSFNDADIAAAAREVELQNRKLFNTQHQWNPHVVFDRFTDLTFATMQSWTRRISVGGKYLEGNSRQQGIDLGLDFERIRERTNTQINFTGQYAEANRARVANRWTINSNTDLKFDNTKWIIFTKIMDEYDELQRLDYRGVYSAGIGYHWLDKPDRRLITRFGPAATVEVYQRPSFQRFTADMFAELELRCPLGERVQFEHKTSVHPTLTNFELVRLLTNSSLNYSLDESKQWSLRVGVQYIYISLPNAGRLPYDVSTNLSIVYQRK